MKRFIYTISILFTLWIQSSQTMASNNELLAFSSPLQEELANKENAQLPVVPLFSDFLKIKKLYNLEPYEIRYNRVAGSNGYQLIIPEGRIILVEWKNQLHEINYQIGIEDREKQLRKLKYLFSKYKNQFEWSLWLDNGFGKFFESSNHTVQGMWAYQLDTISFVSQEFYEAPKEPNK